MEYFLSKLLPLFVYPLGLAILLSLLGMSAYTGKLLYANYSASSSQADIKIWQLSNVIPDEESWQEALDGSQVAIKFDLNNPKYLG